MDKARWPRLAYRAAIAIFAVANVVVGANGIVTQNLSTGTGSWFRGAWRADGTPAVVLGAVIMLFGLYLLVLVIRHR